MCRLYAFHANEETKVECTLVHAQNSLLIQSQGDATGRLHSDGWGIGYYRDRNPKVEKNVTAAYRGLHFSTSAERVYARTVIAHVRMATIGGGSIVNCHPFRWGRWIFAHNGTVRGVDQLRPDMLQEIGPELATNIRGETDSELLFHWIVARLEAQKLIEQGGRCELSAVSQAFAQAVVEIDRRCARVDPAEPAKLNLVLTNGRQMVATRMRNTLVWVARHGVHDCEICGIPHVHHDRSVPYEAVVIASEPLSSESWQEIPDGSIVTVDANMATTLARLPLGAPYEGSVSSRRLI